MIRDSETLRPVRRGRLSNADDNSASDTWWGSFRKTQVHLTSCALQVLETDARWIAGQIYYEPEEGLGVSAWPKSRIRTGIVVGSVQSGKTANMLAVSSILLDRGIGLLIILSGTQIGLWLQTYERVLSHLDGTDVDCAYKKNNKRVIAPPPGDVLNSNGRLDPSQYFKGVRYKIQEAIMKEIPAIIVIPKQVAHMQALKKCLRECYVDRFILSRKKPLRMVVLDDEADDASVLDSIQENKLTPWSIQDFWSHEVNNSETLHRDLYACYVAYTATPQANFLQETHNPLAPKDFAAALRTPGALGCLSPRTTTFTEPSGLSHYYTGGWAFYELLRNYKDSFCVTSPFPSRLDNESDSDYIIKFNEQRIDTIGSALRSYFVACAFNLIHQRKNFSTIINEKAKPLNELISVLPSPHTMLLHPSGVVQDQFDGAKEIEKWSIEKLLLGPDFIGNIQDHPRLSPEGLALRLHDEEPLWEFWCKSFLNTANELRDIPGAAFPCLEDCFAWENIKRVLCEEVFPNVKIKVLNSDPRASDRPSFSPKSSPDRQGLYEMPDDVLTIFVAGNVLSRGVTLEGLTTSVFLRSVNEPAADTQMQMQRWFGYRGKSLLLCRVFLYQDQLDLFRAYHDSDEATKSQILNSMEESEPFANNILILHGEEYWATKKVASTRLPLHPGPAPTVKLVEEGSLIVARNNLKILESVVNVGKWVELEAPKGTLRGRIRNDPVDIDTVCDLLDKFSFSHHKPTICSPAYERWEALRQQLGSDKNFFNSPDILANECLATKPSSCPYTIAAYLRLWKFLSLKPNYRGFYPTNNPKLRWHFASSQYHKINVPMFYLGVRFGNLSDCPIESPFSIPCMRRSLKEKGVLKTLWGTRGRESTYLGDEFFDYHFHQKKPFPELHSENRWRPLGHPGLLLFHAIKNDPDTYFLSVGLSIPHGGPDHIAAIRGN